MRFFPAVAAVVLVPGVCWALSRAGGGDEETRQLAYVVQDEMPLLALPEASGSPELGRLLRGTALLVHEIRGDFARVSLNAWVATSDLGVQQGAIPVEPGGLAGPALEVGDESQLPPLDDWKRTYQVMIRRAEEASEGESEGGDQGAGAAMLSIELGLGTAARRRIDAGVPVELLVSVFEEHEVAGGRVRGELLARRQVTLRGTSMVANVFERTSEAASLQRVRVTARGQLPDDRWVYGSLSLALDPSSSSGN